MSQFIVTGLTTNTDSLLGIWETGQDSGLGVSFSVNEPKRPPVPTFQVSLSDDMGQATRQLDHQMQTLGLARFAGQTATQEMKALVPRDEHEVSFSTLTMDEPTARLARNLAYLQGKSTSAEGLSFTTGDIPPSSAEWHQTVGEFEAAMKQIFELIQPTLRVETDLGERKFATSTVGITGNTQTSWHYRGAPDQVAVHQQVLTLSLETRLSLVRLLGHISTGAVALAAKFSLPGGQLMALPAAWKYIQDTIKHSKTDYDLQRQLRQTKTKRN